MHYSARKPRLSSVPAVILSAMLVVLACSGSVTEGEIPDLGIVVQVSVNLDGAGSGGVTSSEVTLQDGSIESIDCHSSGPFPCKNNLSFIDLNGIGVLTLTADPDPGNVVSWDGSTCMPAATCTITAGSNTLSLTFDSSVDVHFNITASFDPPPPLPADLIAFQTNRDGDSEIYVINPDGRVRRTSR